MSEDSGQKPKTKWVPRLERFSGGVGVLGCWGLDGGAGDGPQPTCCQQRSRCQGSVEGIVSTRSQNICGLEIPDLLED